MDPMDETAEPYFLDSVQFTLEHLGIASDDRLPEVKAVSMRSPEVRGKLIDTA